MIAAPPSESLDGHADDDVDEAWANAIKRRLEEVRDGSVDLVDGDEVHRAIRARLTTRRQ